jgi:hypothetical protein
MNLYPVTVVENFYEKPNVIRQFALNQKYQYCHEIPNINYVFPGCRTKDLSTLNPHLFAEICKKLVSLFHISEHDYMRWAITTSFQSVTAEFGKGVIHTDHNTVFAAVLYLTPDAPLNSGTSLYKPNAQFDEEQYQAEILKNDDNFKANLPISYDYHHMFDEIVRVNNVYNTLILYEGAIFHAANQFFGDHLKNARLAQVFFVSKIDANKSNSFPLNRIKDIAI